MNFLIDAFDYSLIYQPNLLFCLFFLLLIIATKIFFNIAIHSSKIVAEIHSVHKSRKQLLVSKKSFFMICTFAVVGFVRSLIMMFHILNSTLQNIERFGGKIAAMIKKEMFLPCIVVFLFTVSSPVYAASYTYPWPGILPDHPLYTVKVVRNKIIERLIIRPERKIEFDLLMADKTLYASKILQEKGSHALALETALKGENYFSILVADYRNLVGNDGSITKSLWGKINSAYEAHQLLISDLREHAPDQDKKMYESVDYFSKENYRALQNLAK